MPESNRPNKKAHGDLGVFYAAHMMSLPLVMVLWTFYHAAHDFNASGPAPVNSMRSHRGCCCWTALISDDLINFDIFGDSKDHQPWQASN